MELVYSICFERNMT